MGRWGGFSEKQRQALFDRDGRKCLVCGWRPEDGPQRYHANGLPVICVLEADHITPVADNGTPDDGNLQTLCTRCNASKGTRSMADFLYLFTLKERNRMTWFKVDDNLAFHAKALKAGNPAMGMWVRAGSECSSQLTDGFVANEMVTLLGGRALARKLVGAGLWHEADGGYLFHEWDERQPTKAQVERDRDLARTRKEQWKERQRNAVPTPVPNGGKNGGENGGGAPAPTRPDPTRPENQERAPAGAADLVAYFIDLHAKRPPGRVVGQIAKRVGELRTEGFDYEAIKGGLDIVAAKGLAPSALDSCVNEVANKPLAAGAYDDDYWTLDTSGDMDLSAFDEPVSA